MPKNVSSQLYIIASAGATGEALVIALLKLYDELITSVHFHRHYIAVISHAFND